MRLSISVVAAFNLGELLLLHVVTTRAHAQVHLQRVPCERFELQVVAMHVGEFMLMHWLSLVTNVTTMTTGYQVYVVQGTLSVHQVSTTRRSSLGQV